MTRADHIAVVPFRLAMRKSRRGTNRQRVSFYTTGLEHSLTSATGTGVGAHALARDAARAVEGADPRPKWNISFAR